MIRLIKRRLIIPRGDTGSFSIPTLGMIDDGDIAVFGIFDKLTHETKLLKMIYATTPTLTFNLKWQDTIDLEPKKYNWDIAIYRSPVFDEDGELIGAAEVNSYYSAYKLPICEIKDVAFNMHTQLGNAQDLLSEIQEPLPTYARVPSMPSIYPWEVIQLSILAEQMYKLAKAGGYTGSAEDFDKKFGKLLEEKAVNFFSRSDFPEEGEEDKLYFDLEEKILYYWDNNEYLPVNTTLIANSIIQGGEV